MKVITLLMMILFVLLLFLFFSGKIKGSSSYTISGDSVFYSNSYGKLVVSPHTSDGISGHNIQFLELTNYLGGQDFDFAFAFNESIINSRAWLWKNMSHNITRLSNTSFSCDVNLTHVSGICYDWVVNGSYLGYYPDWFDISSMFNHVSYHGREWYLVEDINFGFNETKRVKLMYDAKNKEGKWDLYMKRSSDSLADALSSGHYVVIDPWWNESTTWFPLYNDSFNGVFNDSFYTRNLKGEPALNINISTTQWVSSPSSLLVASTTSDNTGLTAHTSTNFYFNKTQARKFTFDFMHQSSQAEHKMGGFYIFNQTTIWDTTYYGHPFGSALLAHHPAFTVSNAPDIRIGTTWDLTNVLGTHASNEAQSSWWRVQVTWLGNGSFYACFDDRVGFNETDCILSGVGATLWAKMDKLLVGFHESSSNPYNRMYVDNFVVWTNESGIPQNTAPVIIAGVIDLFPAYFSSVLNATGWAYSDADNNSGNISCWWKKNGVVQDSYNYSVELSNGTVFNFPNKTSGVLVAFDNWTASCRGVDAGGLIGFGDVNITIHDIPHTIIEFPTTNFVNNSGIFTANFSFTDTLNNESRGANCTLYLNNIVNQTFQLSDKESKWVSSPIDVDAYSYYARCNETISNKANTSLVQYWVIDASSPVITGMDNIVVYSNQSILLDVTLNDNYGIKTGWMELGLPNGSWINVSNSELSWSSNSTNVYGWGYNIVLSWQNNTWSQPNHVGTYYHKWVAVDLAGRTYSTSGSDTFISNPPEIPSTGGGGSYIPEITTVVVTQAYIDELLANATGGGGGGGSSGLFGGSVVVVSNLSLPFWNFHKFCVWNSVEGGVSCSVFDSANVVLDSCDVRVVSNQLLNVNWSCEVVDTGVGVSAVIPDNVRDFVGLFTEIEANVVVRKADFVEVVNVRFVVVNLGWWIKFPIPFSVSDGVSGGFMNYFLKNGGVDSSGVRLVPIFVLLFLVVVGGWFGWWGRKRFVIL